MTLNPTDPAHGEEWDVVEFIRNKDGRPRGDGDTVTIVRTGLRRLGDKLFHVTDAEPQPARLCWVDTPERGDHPGYAQADLDLDTWILERLGTGRRITAYCFDGGAGWDRLLVNLVDDLGESASEYLMRRCGWPMYEA